MSRLPPVDPDYLVDEGDPETLAAYAKGLWQHLQDIRAGGDNNGYPIETIKAATVWLVGRYVDSKAPLPHEIYLLAQDIIRPKARQRTSAYGVLDRRLDAYWAAIAFEARFPEDPSGRQPSTATLYSVAKHIRQMVGQRGDLKTAEAIVKPWRNKQHYRDNVRLHRPSPR